MCSQDRRRQAREKWLARWDSRDFAEPDSTDQQKARGRETKDER